MEKEFNKIDRETLKNISKELDLEQKIIMEKEIYDKLKLIEKDYPKQDFIDTLKYIVAEETIIKLKQRKKNKNEN